MWLTAIILGLTGSLHCVGMCSPLVMAVTSFNSKVFLNRILYNGGRVFTYGILGSLIAYFGVMINFSRFQFFLTLSIAVTLILMGLSGLSGMRIPLLTPILVKFTSIVKAWFATFLKQKTYFSLWTLGMINGLLPCGLTYLALTYCLTLAGPVDGFQFMLLFGIGTLPAMIGLTSVLGYLVKRFGLNINTITRFSFILIGGIVLARLYFSQHHMLDHATEQVGIIFCR